jgi:hypothetical protein
MAKNLNTVFISFTLLTVFSSGASSGVTANRKTTTLLLM